MRELDDLMELADCYAIKVYNLASPQYCDQEGKDTARAELKGAIQKALHPDLPDPRKFLQALQWGEMSVSRAEEILDAWLHGTYSDDMVPGISADSTLLLDDDLPMDVVRRLRLELKKAEADARDYRYLRSKHWNKGGLCVVDNKDDRCIYLGAYCPSGNLLDEAIAKERGDQ